MRRIMLFVGRAVISVLLFSVAGCGGKDSTPPLVPTSIIASASSIQLDAIGATQQFTVTVRDQNGATLSSASPSSSSSAPGVVAATGGATVTLTAVSNGTTLVTITAGSAMTTVSVTVSQVPVAPIKVSGDTQSGTVGSALPTMIRVKLQDRLGVAVANRDVSFAPAAGNGFANPSSASTGTDGTASSTWTIGSTAGAQSLSASTTGVAAAAVYTATGTPGAAASVRVYAGNNQTAPIGTALTSGLSARVADAFDNPVANVAVTFIPTTGHGTMVGTTSITNALGVATSGAWTMPTTAGAKTATASANGLTPASFAATATAGPAAVLAINGGSGQNAGANTAVVVAPSVKVSDTYGNPVSGTVVTFAVASGGGSVTGASATSNSAGIATVGSWTVGNGSSANTLTASAPGLNAVTFTANVVAAPVIAAIAPTTLTPGGTLTLTGTGFAATVAGNTLRVGSIAATISAASTNSLTATVPCMASGSVSVTVTSNGTASNATAATIAGSVRSLAVGQAFVASTSAASLCNELPATGASARYLISVYSTATSANSLTDFELGGNPAASAASVRFVAPLRASRAPLVASGPETLRDQMHGAHLERERVRYEQLRAAAQRLPASSREPSALASAAAPAVGDQRTFYWPWTSCTDTLTRITARVIYAGTKAIVWEDLTNALQSTIDASLADRYSRIGQVFDLDQYDVVRTTFGDPLRRDAVTDNDGRVHMLFTHRVNDVGGVAAFVTSADQYPRSVCATSNFGEFFYGSVATTSGSNLNSVSYPDGWYNFMNRTVVHEVKHIASMAARVANNASSWEASWLEEGTARHAEEVWARQALHHTAWGGNNGYGTAANNGMYCDFNPSNATCLANDALRRPSYGVRRQFNEILPKLQEPWNWSLYADGTGQSGSVFYQTVWSLVRYAIDRYGTSDAAFLTALTSASTSGATNLSAVAGVPFDQLVGQWSLALYADDYPGMTSPSADLLFSTWNLRAIYSALHSDPVWSSRFTTAYPITPTTLSFGAFTAQQSGVRGGANAFFEISGTASTAQVLNLRALGGGSASGLLRIAIARLQ